MKRFIPLRWLTLSQKRIIRRPQMHLVSTLRILTLHICNTADIMLQEVDMDPTEDLAVIMASPLATFQLLAITQPTVNTSSKQNSSI